MYRHAVVLPTHLRTVGALLNEKYLAELVRKSCRVSAPLKHCVHSWSGPNLTTRQLATSQVCVGTVASHGTQEGKDKVIVLTGATAVGKTKASIELAQRIGGEIISADSVQVYKGLDVGSDKVQLSLSDHYHPDATVHAVTCECPCCLSQILPAERGGIPHHLIDILSPHEEFSAGDFFERARAATADILQVCYASATRDVSPKLPSDIGHALCWHLLLAASEEEI